MHQFEGAVVTDVDGTLKKGSWQMILNHHLLERGHLSAERFEKVLRLRHAYRQRVTRFKEFSDAHVEALVTDGWRDLQVAHVEQAVAEILEEHGRNVFEFTRSVIRAGRKRNRLLVAISGSNIESVEAFCKPEGFHEVIATRFPKKDGRYTGGPPDFWPAQKDRVMREILAKHHIDPKDVVGMGDTAHDLPMLAEVGYPIAFEPTGQMLDEIADRVKRLGNARWPVAIVRESKDAITATSLLQTIHGEVYESTTNLANHLPGDLWELVRRDLGHLFKFQP